MANVKCVRCLNDNPALSKPPFNDDLGRTILEKVCQPCWSEWTAMQIRIINEYRLSLGDPQAQKILTEQLKAFLNLGG